MAPIENSGPKQDPLTSQVARNDGGADAPSAFETITRGKGKILTLVFKQVTYLLCEFVE